ncbi:MAG: nucleotidyltransferase family protein [Deltaproteobacteria bacterium]|nr:nucleotidyltransferase family protein [Deltaproteobacteria bacterium]
MAIPAVVTAGDRGAAKAVHGERKVFLDIVGCPLVAYVAAMLQRVPEVSEVWVIGDAERLRAVFERDDVRRQIAKPLHILEQGRNLYENTWQAYRCLLPGAGPEGRDPEPADIDTQVLYVSGDLPFATPQEISQFVQRGQALGCDYAVGLVTEESMHGFLPVSAPAQPGLRMATFNLREGRYRQSNLHLAKPARLGNRHYIEEMYQHRHQRELGQILGLAWTLLTSERGGLRVLSCYALMHVAGVADRWHLRRLANWVRCWIPIAQVERGCSDLLRTEFRFVVTEIGGCAIDVDTELEYDVASQRHHEWREAQNAVAERRYGPLPLPERAGRGGGESGTA